MNNHSHKGFTLIEIAIVLLIVSIILGYTVAMVPVQQELKQYREAEAEMDRIVESLYAFAEVNGYLPCPAWSNDIANPTPTQTSNGFECRDGGDASACDQRPPTDGNCEHFFGFLPGKTLGLEGRYSSVNKLLLDPWGMPYRYQVTNSDGGVGLLTEDFVTPGAMKQEQIANLRPDLVICSVDPSATSAGTDDECLNAAQVIFGAYNSNACTGTDVDCAPAVVLSTGKDAKNDLAELQANNWVQRENLDNSINDRVFVKTSRVEQGTEDAGGNALEYDDVVRWVSPNILYSRMIKAGQLP
jgi:prepilin-type N-terminal cleavage/methylation domain-containing protein